MGGTLNDIHLNLHVIALFYLESVPAIEDDDSSSGWENSDSAVDSSDDEEMIEAEVRVEDVGNTDSDSSVEDKSDFLSLLGPDGNCRHTQA